MATTTTTQNLPEWYMQYMQDALQRGQSIAKTPFQAYGGQQAVGINPYLQQGWNMIANRAMQGSPLNEQANQVIGDTMSGRYMFNNPYLDQMAAQTRRNVASDINKQFNSNAWGGSAQQELLARGMSEAENALRYGDYSNERQNQLRAANYAPSLSQAGYFDANMMGQLGQQRQTMDYNEFLRGQNWPMTTQQSYLGSLGLSPGGSTTQSAPDPSKASSFLGGAFAGAGLGDLASPWLKKTFGLSDTASQLLGAGTGGLLSAFF